MAEALGKKKKRKETRRGMMGGVRLSAARALGECWAGYWASAGLAAGLACAGPRCA